MTDSISWGWEGWADLGLSMKSGFKADLMFPSVFKKFHKNLFSENWKVLLCNEVISQGQEWLELVAELRQLPKSSVSSLLCLRRAKLNPQLDDFREREGEPLTWHLKWDVFVTTLPSVLRDLWRTVTGMIARKKVMGSIKEAVLGHNIQMYMWTHKDYEEDTGKLKPIVISCLHK